MKKSEKYTGAYIFLTLTYRLVILLRNLVCSCTSLHKFKRNTKPAKLTLHLPAFRKPIYREDPICTGSGPVFKPLKILSYNRYLPFIFEISTNRDKTKHFPVYFHYHWFALHLFSTTHRI